MFYSKPFVCMGTKLINAGTFQLWISKWWEFIVGIKCLYCWEKTSFLFNFENLCLKYYITWLRLPIEAGVHNLFYFIWSKMAFVESCLKNVRLLYNRLVGYIFGSLYQISFSIVLIKKCLNLLKAVILVQHHSSRIKSIISTRVVK